MAGPVTGVTSRRATVLDGAPPLKAAGALGAVGLLLVAITASVACGTEPVGVEACRRIEKTRCESAQACGIDLGYPAHEGDTPERNVAACIRYYDDQCMHGLVVTKEPAPEDVDRCVDAIIQGDCTVVKAPESHPSCAFLNPPATPALPPADGGDSDASPVTDAATD